MSALQRSVKALRHGDRWAFERLRVVGETNDVRGRGLSGADRDMAGIASRQAGLVAANIRVLITGEGGLTSYEPFPPLIAIRSGPRGGAGSLGQGVAYAATIAEIKGRNMLIGN